MNWIEAQPPLPLPISAVTSTFLVDLVQLNVDPLTALFQFSVLFCSMFTWTVIPKCWERKSFCLFVFLSKTQMDLSSFLTSLGTSFAIFLILMFLFSWLSRKPGNTVVYYPNRILKGLEPWEGGSKTRNPFAWVKEALSSTEQEVISVSGVDTAVYFVFLSTGLSLTLCLLIVS